MPHTLRAASLVSYLSAALLTTAVVIEQLAGAGLRVAGWPVFWVALTLFFAAMVDRPWGRQLLALQAALSVPLSPNLVYSEGTALDPVPRPEVAVAVALLAVGCLLLAAVLAYFPASTAYIRANGRRELSRPLRKSVLVVHVTSSVAMLGLITTQGMLGITALHTVESGVTKGMFAAMVAIDGTFLGPVAFLAFFSGLVVAAGTRWRLLHRWWVAAKFALMVVSLGLAAFVWQDIADRGYALATAGHSLTEIRAAIGTVSYLTMVSPVLVMAAVVLSITKPWGLTPLGQRHQATPRRAVTDVSQPLRSW